MGIESQFPAAQCIEAEPIALEKRERGRPRKIKFPGAKDSKKPARRLCRKGVQKKQTEQDMQMNRTKVLQMKKTDTTDKWVSSFLFPVIEHNVYWYFDRARRTSPQNIVLLVLSCISHIMDFSLHSL